MYLWISGRKDCEHDQEDLAKGFDKNQDSLMSKKPKENGIKESMWSIVLNIPNFKWQNDEKVCFGINSENEFT